MTEINKINLGELIKKKRKEAGLSARELAEKLGSSISEVNIYKWEGGSIPQDPEVYIKIRDWLNLETGINNQLNEDKPAYGNRSADQYLKPFIESLQEQKRILEVQNDFLRRNFETSLNSIVVHQHAANSQLKALGWYQAFVANGGDEKKAETALAKMNNKAAWYAGVGEQAGTHPESDKKRKSD